jgi:hypothetical protein
MASYTVNPEAVARARRMIDARQYVLESDWGDVQPRADAQNAYLERHSWADYAGWHLGLTEGAADETKARYAFVYGDFRRVHRTPAQQPSPTANQTKQRPALTAGPAGRHGSRVECWSHCEMTGGLPATPLRVCGRQSGGRPDCRKHPRLLRLRRRI